MNVYKSTRVAALVLLLCAILKFGKNWLSLWFLSSPLQIGVDKYIGKTACVENLTICEKDAHSILLYGNLEKDNQCTNMIAVCRNEVEEMKKERYGFKKMLQEFLGLIHYVWMRKKSVYMISLFYIAAFVVSGFLQVYLPKATLAELEEGRTMKHLAIVLGILSGMLLMSLFLEVKFKVRIKNVSVSIVKEMQMEYVHKLLYTDYSNVENKQFCKLRDNAKEVLYGGKIGDENVSATLGEFMPALNTCLGAFGSIVIYSILLCRLSPVLIVVILVTSFGATYVSTQWGRSNLKTYGELASGAFRKAQYATERTGDFSMAKDVRLYQMENWLLHVVKKYTKERLHYKGMELRHDAGAWIISNIIIGIQHICVYLYLIHGVLQGNISASDLVLYAGIVNSSSQSFDSFLQPLTRISRMAMNYGKFQQLMSYGTDAKEEVVSVKKEKAELTLEHVSFRFPGEEKDLLHDLNLTVSSSEKLAIVGINGAGKTTLMKLICGLLTPTEGKILLNGQDMAELSPDERYAWFSCAFQDITFLPLSIRENISMCTKNGTDDKRVLECLDMAGMKEKVLSMPDGLDALMEKNMNENAVDFSGGERQKLILARALYRNASVLILDEPTAALDPLAENEIYQRYAAFAAGKTSFFVSHRLSSTSFCDRILLLDNGRIAEMGTHEELLNRGGLYARMFELQSHYYQEEHSAHENTSDGIGGVACENA